MKRDPPCASSSAHPADLRARLGFHGLPPSASRLRTGWPGRCSRTRCSGTGCRRWPRGCPARWASLVRARKRAAGHQHARRAIAALQAVLLPEAFLDGVQLAVALEPLDGRDLTAVGLHRHTVHDFTGWPSSSTVHAPQWVVSQPMCVPVSRKLSRKRCTRRRRDSTSASRAAPFTVTVILVRAHVTDLPRAGLPASGRAPPAPAPCRACTRPSPAVRRGRTGLRGAPRRLRDQPRRSASDQRVFRLLRPDRRGADVVNARPTRSNTPLVPSVTCAAAAAVA